MNTELKRPNFFVFIVYWRVFPRFFYITWLLSKNLISYLGLSVILATGQHFFRIQMAAVLIGLFACEFKVCLKWPSSEGGWECWWVGFIYYVAAVFQMIKIKPYFKAVWWILKLTSVKSGRTWQSEFHNR